MKIHQIFFKNTLRNFCYLIVFDNEVIYCIDPFDSVAIINTLDELYPQKNIQGIINTHDHCDHYSGNEELVKKYHCSVMAYRTANIPFKNRELGNKEVIYEFQEWKLESLFTPGHTMSHVCVLLKKNDQAYALFTGDCFFNAGVGNCHNGGNPEILYETISKIFTNFSDELLIYPGHEYLKRNLEFSLNCEPSNKIVSSFLAEIQALNLDDIHLINDMKKERQINPFLRLSNIDLRKQVGVEFAEEKKVFLTLRELRNRW